MGRTLDELRKLRDKAADLKLWVLVGIIDLAILELSHSIPAIEQPEFESESNSRKN